jgi:hypothetical protein
MLRPIWALLQGLDAEHVKVVVQPLAAASFEPAELRDPLAIMM